MDAKAGRREALGLAVLLLTTVPAYLLVREETPEVVSQAADTLVAAADAAAADAGVEEAAGSAKKPTRRRVLDKRAIEAHIREVAERYGISPKLVAAIIEAESEFNPHAVSRRGARGLMQLMPATASSLDVSDSFDPYANIEGGVRHLRRLMDRFDGDLPLVLAAYNAGETAVIVYGGIPPYRETRRYVARILRRIGHDVKTHRGKTRGEARGAGGKRRAGAPA